MPRNTRARCQICDEKESRYTCPGSDCLVEYCSVACYKQHKETSCGSEIKKAERNDVSKDQGHGPQPLSSDDDDIAKDVPPLRPLTSLKWPYLPEESAYPDPLKRDDPKPLQLAQYEAIATSPAVRAALTAHPGLKEVLRTIDGLRGLEREEALQVALGVSRRDVGRSGGGSVEIDSEIGERGMVGIGEGERHGMRGLAEALEGAVRGSREGLLLGLDWEEEMYIPERG